MSIWNVDISREVERGGRSCLSYVKSRTVICAAFDERAPLVFLVIFFSESVEPDNEDADRYSDRDHDKMAFGEGKYCCMHEDNKAEKDRECHTHFNGRDHELHAVLL